MIISTLIPLYWLPLPIGFFLLIILLQFIAIRANHWEMKRDDEMIARLKDENTKLRANRDHARQVIGRIHRKCEDTSKSSNP